MDLSNKHILFAISPMGLGHVYRSLPVIRLLLDAGSRISIFSNGRALSALKLELAGQAVEYQRLKEYPAIQAGRGIFQDLFLLRDLIYTGYLIKKERQQLKQIIAEKQIDMVFADGCFGFTSQQVPCFLICHQIRFLLPLRLFIFQPIMDFSQYYILRHHTKIIVPDHDHPNDNLSGKLSHNWISRRLQPLYIGFLSSARRVPFTDPVDILFITGGFIDRERKHFITWAKQFLSNASQRVVLVQGEHMQPSDIIEHEANIEIRANICGTERDQLMSSAQLLVGRTGYTTLMDICELKIKSVLLPTPRMTEQSYLGCHIAKWQHTLPDQFKTTSQQPWVGFNVDTLPETLKTWSTEQSIQKLTDFLSTYIHE